MRLFEDERGQMAVELAIAIPIILVIMVFAIDALVFAGECARFDQLAPQHVLACATSPAKDSYDPDTRRASIQAALEADFAKNGSSVTVASDDAGVTLASMSVYTCTFKFAPWPFSSASAPPTLEHVCRFSIDPYTPGELL